MSRGMKILLDLGAIKTGGGAQLATNFLEYLEQHAAHDHDFALLIPEIGPLAALERRRGYLRVLVSPRSYRARLQLENGRLQRFIADTGIDAIFTFFGAGLPHPPAVRSVVSVAYPVICYPESPYWLNAGVRERLQVRALNWMRVHRLRQASAIIAETEVMKERVSKVLRFPAERIRVIPPAVSAHVRHLDRAEGAAARRFAFVSGNETHKNLWRLYEIARCAAARGFADFTFHLTVTRAAYLRRLSGRPHDLQLIDRHFDFIGPVAPREVMHVYEKADCVVSLSDLESFSNNYMEAWKVGLPLIVSDRDFARAICGASALYVDPHDTQAVVAALLQVRADPVLRRRLVAEGARRLGELPTLPQRTSQVLAELGAA
jgi:glycosyltransferase involved in cell wall biosynthesis